MDFYDNWSNRKLHDKFSSFLKTEKIESLIIQENLILKWINTKDIQKALKRRELVAANVRRLHLQKLLLQRTANYDLTGKTV